METHADDSSTQSKLKAPRLYHKKSRTGCQRCRARRVKCDEAHPTCRSCNRHSVACIYDKEPLTQKSSPKGRSSTRSTSQPSEPSPSQQQALLDSANLSNTRPNDVSIIPPADLFDIPESKSRRVLELRLLQNFITSTSATLPSTHNADLRNCWINEVPKLALTHENLLYEILSLSSLHLLKTAPHDPELIEARQIYQGLSSREHRSAISQLSNLTADPACFASALIVVDAFASMQDRSIEPYSPPTGWLHMSRGAWSVFRAALHAVEDYEPSKINVLINAEPYLGVETLFLESNRVDLLDLLTQAISSEGEIWDEETRDTYEKTLSYIGTIRKGIKDGEHALSLCRRVISFAIMAPEIFIRFLEEGRPRALTILAHYFATTAKLDNWIMGNAAQREILGILAVLPVEWHALMSWPLEVVESKLGIS